MLASTVKVRIARAFAASGRTDQSRKHFGDVRALSSAKQFGRRKVAITMSGAIHVIVEKLS
jgi:hypothetical protein